MSKSRSITGVEQRLKMPWQVEPNQNLSGTSTAWGERHSQIILQEPPGVAWGYQIVTTWNHRSACVLYPKVFQTCADILYEVSLTFSTSCEEAESRVWPLVTHCLAICTYWPMPESSIHVHTWSHDHFEKGAFVSLQNKNVEYEKQEWRCLHMFQNRSHCMCFTALKNRCPGRRVVVRPWLWNPLS